MTIVYTFICIILFVVVLVAIHMALEQSDDSSPQTWVPDNPEDWTFPTDEDGQVLSGYDLEDHIDHLIRKWQKSRTPT